MDPVDHQERMQQIRDRALLQQQQSHAQQRRDAWIFWPVIGLFVLAYVLLAGHLATLGAARDQATAARWEETLTLLRQQRDATQALADDVRRLREAVENADGTP
jgi:hypothetical protein